MKLKKLIAASVMSAMLLASLTACGNGESSATPDKTSGPVSTAESTVESTPEAEPTRGPVENPNTHGDPVYDYSGSDKVGDLLGVSAMDITSKMGFGINIGNTFDSTGGVVKDVLSHEKSWGNAQVTQEYVDALYEAGFTTVRIPTTWELFIKEENGEYTIYEAYLNRVREVVDYCYQHDMFVILNVHHEGWVNNDKLVTNKDAIAKELGDVWSVIADYFADYDQHLIFETMNEPRLAGTDLEWSGNTEAYEVINYFNQVTTNAIRGTKKGHNDERCIMIPQYAASSSANIMAALSIPTFEGAPVKNIIASVHCYTPYDFCLSDQTKTFDPDNAAQTSGIDSIFANIKSEFLDQGIPAVIGETSATNSNENHAERAKWAGYMGKMAASFGVPIVLWDNGYGGNSGGECHLYIDRVTGENPHPEVLEALFAPLKSVEWGSFSELGTSAGGSEGTETPEEKESIVGGRVISSWSDGLESTKLWDNGYIMLGASESYFTGNKDIYIAYEGAGRAVMILDSEACQQWWMPVENYEETEIGGKKVQIFKGDEIKKVMESFGVTSYSQLRNMCFVAADDNITTYEVASVGEGYSVMFKVNGNTVYTGAEGDMPANPTVEGLEFLGWYTTKTFDEGTEYTGGALTEDVTVYAKLGLK